MGEARTKAQAAALAARELAQTGAGQRDEALRSMAQALLEATPRILEANQADMVAARVAGTPAALLDRLRLDERRVADMAAGLRGIAAQPDPLGRVVGGSRLPNGLQLERVTVPLGVVAMVYEARPNVTSDAAGLCLKAGDACVLRGGSLALRSNVAIAAALVEGAGRAGLPAGAVQLTLR